MTPGAIAEQRRQHYNATVAWLRKPNPDLMLVRIRPDKPRAAHRPHRDRVFLLRKRPKP